MKDKLLSNMYKKKIRIFAFIFFLILLIGLIFNFFFPDKCKTSKIYVPIKDLGFSVIYNCFDEYLIVDEAIPNPYCPLDHNCIILGPTTLELALLLLNLIRCLRSQYIS